MLEAGTVILVALWIIGLITSHTWGGLIHALLAIAVVMMGRRL